MVCRILAAAALFAVAGCGARGAAIPGQSARYAATSQPVTYAAYAWNAGDVTSRWKAGTLWSFAQALHIKTFMLGFTDADIAKYSRAKGTAQMNAMIAEGKRHGVTFELLLGDPGWIPPSGVPLLDRILHRLRNVHFAGLNLDLEPNEVKGMPIKTVVIDLASAMKQYVAKSSWPVALDANWIYMNNGNKFNGGYCYPCGLESAGVKRIALLVYISDAKTVYAVSAPILKRYPSFTFTIAQSVEPPSVLPKQDSYWHDGFAAFYTDMQRLDAKLRTQANYAGLDVESLQYLETIPS
jgi:hypothetical protein